MVDPLMLQVIGAVAATALLIIAYAAGNSHCSPDRLGRGCGTLRWAAVQIRRKVPSMCASALSPALTRSLTSLPL